MTALSLSRIRRAWRNACAEHPGGLVSQKLEEKHVRWASPFVDDLRRQLRGCERRMDASGALSRPFYAASVRVLRAAIEAAEQELCAMYVEAAEGVEAVQP